MANKARDEAGDRRDDARPDFERRNAPAPEMRIGQGYDVHRLQSGRRLILGGVGIPWEKGLLGHSDADCLMHAVTDALLGALGRGDVGRLFPDDDPQFEGADSGLLLRQAAILMRADGYETVNVDATVIAQQPKLAPFVEDMRANIADALGMDPGRVNVKAKTNEGLGYLGQSEAIAAQAAILLRRA